MKKRAFILGGLLFLVDLVINAGLIYNGAFFLGIFSLFVGILVFSCGMIWLIHRDDETLHIKKAWLVIPLALFGVGIAQTLSSSGLELQITPENLQEVGNLLMSRYQMGLWMTAVLILMGFVAAGTIMMRRRT